jgi:hypothetical protein
MIMRTTLLLSVLFLLGACGDDWWLHHHRLPQGPSHPGSGGGGGDDAIADFAGSWQERDAQPGYAAFMVLESDGEGYLCNEDGKSQAEFELVVDGARVLMGAYGYGGGDELTLAQGEIIRTGQDHGETYTVRYTSVDALPEWCRLQIREMQQD